MTDHDIALEVTVEQKNQKPEHKNADILNSTLNIFRFTIESAWQNIKRHQLLTITSIFSTIVTLMVVYFSLGINYTTSFTISYLGNLVDINIPLYDGISQSEIDSFMGDMELLPYTEGVVFKSKEEALQELQEKYEKAETIDFLSANNIDNPLPNFVKITTKDPADIAKLSIVLKSDTYSSIINVNSLSFDQDYEKRVDTFVKTSMAITNGAFLVTAIFVILSLLIVVTTIKITLHNRRKALKIMRIVGASNIHIELPFVVEALFYGVVAFCISLIPYSFMKNKFIPVLAGQFNVEPAVFYEGFAGYIHQWWMIILLGVLVFNALSSWIVVKEYVSKKIVL